MNRKPLLRTLNIFWVAYSMFILGQFSERFSGSGAAWTAILCACIVLAISLFILMRDVWSPRP
jgi:hypothetical protein